MTTKVLRRVRTITLGLLVLAALPVAPAHAGTAADPLAVGTVVGRGTPDGDSCVLTEPARVVTGAGTTVLRITDDCEVVVVQRSATELAQPARVPGAMVVPAVRRTSPKLPDTSRVQFSGMPLLDGLSPRHAYASQTIYQVDGVDPLHPQAIVMHFYEEFSATFYRNLYTGDLSNVAPEGRCSANPHPLTPVVVNTVDPAACHMWHYSGEDAHVVYGGARYRQAPAVELDPSAGWFLTYTGLTVREDTEGNIEHSCGPEVGRFPVGLFYKCDGEEVELS